MATKNGKSKDLRHFLKAQVNVAQKRFQSLEKDAEKALNGLVARGETTLKSRRKELQGLITRLNVTELSLGTLIDHPAVVKLGKRAGQAGKGLRTGINTLQSRLIEATGVASQQQLRDLKGDLNRLSKKIDAIAGGKKAPAAAVKTPEVNA